MHNAPPKSTTCVLTLAQALLNYVFIPRGVEGADFPISFTQWDVLKVPSKRLFMVRSYVDMQWRSINLTKLDLKVGAYSLKTPVETGELNVVDFTLSPKLKPYSVEGAHAK